MAEGLLAFFHATAYCSVHRLLLGEPDAAYEVSESGV